MRTSKARPPAKPAAPKAQPLPEKTFIIDNGAYSIKAGYAPSFPPPGNEENALASCVTIPNALAKTRSNRVFVGTQLSTHLSDWNEVTFRRPLEKGHIVNWEAEKEIWEHSFFDEKSVHYKETRIANPEDTTLIFAEAPNGLPALQKNADEMIMEEWGFGGYARIVGPTLNAWNDIHSLFGDPVAEGTIDAITPVECLLVVDSGYSHTTITPVYRGQLLQRAIRRLEIGGKHLTNYIKEMISIRQFNMVDETRIMNDVKETACYVSLDFYNDMERTWKGNRKRRQVDTGESIVVDYVLPNPTSNTKGFLRPHDPLSHAKQQASFVSGPSGDVSSDALVLGNERFTVPEILFNPRDIGMKQAGIPEIILESLSVLPTGLHPAFLANVLAVGGNSLLPGFTERLETELRQIASAECVVRVRRANDPVRSTWQGASRFATNREDLSAVAITRQEYFEHGSGWTGRKFAGGG